MALVPRPSLLAAMVAAVAQAKGAACALSGDGSRHFRDLALFCALVPDPFELAEMLTNKDRQRLGSARHLADPLHAAWQLVPSGIREQGHEAYRISPRDDASGFLAEASPVVIVGLIVGESMHVVGPESTSTCKSIAPQWNS